jgi:rhodanese-related sulfurtransferase
MAGIASSDVASMFAARGLTRAHGGPLDGYFPPSGNLRIAELMAESNDLRRLLDETVDGVSCAVVAAATRHGAYNMWLDRTKGCLPRKVQYIVGANDFHEYWDPIRFSEVMMPTPDGKQHGGTEDRGVLDDIVYERIADTFVPVTGRFTRTDTYGETCLRSVYSYKRTEIDLNPRFEGSDAFVSDLPEGARITNTAVPKSGVKYEWRGGKVVVAGIDKSGDVPAPYVDPGTTTVRRVAMVFCGALLFGAGTFMMARARTQAGHGQPAKSAVSAAGAILVALTLGAAAAPAESPTRAPSLYQENSFEPYCGVQSLHRAMRALGKDVPFDSLVTADYISSTNGSTIADLIQAAEDQGIQLLPMTRMTSFLLRELHQPAILHVKAKLGSTEYKHWVLFMGSKDGTAWIYDGDQPGAEMSEEELAARWDGTALLVSTEPVSKSGIWLTMVYPVLLYGGLCTFVVGVLSVIGRRLQQRLNDGARARVGSAVAQAACLVVAAVAAYAGYRFWSGSGYLSESRVVVAVQDSHLGTFLPKVGVKEMAKLVDAPGVTVVDARKSVDYDLGHLPGAISVPVNATAAQYDEALATVPENSTIVVYSQTRYCTFGYTVAKQLMALGYRNIIVFRGGYKEWSDQEQPRG